MIYTVTFNPALDYYLTVKELQFGRVNRTQEVYTQVGGKGINVSRMLGHLGLQSVAYGFVAGFVGEELEKRLQQMGVQTDFIRLPTGCSRINVKLKGEEMTEINAPGPAIDAPAQQALLAKLATLGAGDTLVLAGSVPAGLPEDIYCRMLEAVAPHGVRTVVDATGELLRSVLPYRPYLIKPNHHELGELFDRTLTTPDEVAECAALLQTEGARNVLVSMAGQGALLLEEQGHLYHAAAPRGEERGSVGAGDSMVAGFLAGDHAGPAAALRLGVAAGSATAFSTELGTRAEVEALLEQIAIQ